LQQQKASQLDLVEQAAYQEPLQGMDRRGKMADQLFLVVCTNTQERKGPEGEQPPQEMQEVEDCQVTQGGRHPLYLALE
jgi:hypothetical protein